MMTPEQRKMRARARMLGRSTAQAINNAVYPVFDQDFEYWRDIAYRRAVAAARWARLSQTGHAAPSPAGSPPAGLPPRDKEQ